MNVRELRSAGHWPTLLAAFVYFDFSFCIWYLLGPLGNFIVEDLHLSATQLGFLIATPLLGGSLFRIVMGALADHFGPRRMGLVGIALTFVPLYLGWAVADTLPELFVVALLLGIPGASFAVALPLASRWYPPHLQGLVMGIAGAGNSGTVLAALFMPRIASAIGWHGAMGVAMLPMAAAGLVFFLCAKDSPTQPGAKRLADYLAVLREADAIWFCFFYAITFGGFVGLASFLGVFFHDQYLVSKVAAGDLTALCVVGGSFMRPVGGMLADRHGGIRVLGGVYGAAALLLVAIATLPGVGLVTPLFIATLALLGAGNGAVFQLVPIRFSREIGVVTGLVGAAGGLGGFFLPSLLGFLKDLTGTYASGFAILAALCVWAMTLIVAISGAWRLTWATEARSA
jgi:NNP family nitrate/nitrite transporter-like MFS transporter